MNFGDLDAQLHTSLPWGLEIRFMPFYPYIYFNQLDLILVNDGEAEEWRF